MRNFKKKLAGFLAAVMAFSVLPAVPVQAITGITPDPVILTVGATAATASILVEDFELGDTSGDGSGTYELATPAAFGFTVQNAPAGVTITVTLDTANLPTLADEIDLPLIISIARPAVGGTAIAENTGTGTTVTITNPYGAGPVTPGDNVVVVQWPEILPQVAVEEADIIADRNDIIEDIEDIDYEDVDDSVANATVTGLIAAAINIGSRSADGVAFRWARGSSVAVDFVIWYGTGTAVINDALWQTTATDGGTVGGTAAPATAEFVQTGSAVIASAGLFPDWFDDDERDEIANLINDMFRNAIPQGGGASLVHETAGAGAGNMWVNVPGMIGPNNPATAANLQTWLTARFNVAPNIFIVQPLVAPQPRGASWDTSIPGPSAAVDGSVLILVNVPDPTSPTGLRAEQFPVTIVAYRVPVLPLAPDTGRDLLAEAARGAEPPAVPVDPAFAWRARPADHFMTPALTDTLADTLYANFEARAAVPGTPAFNRGVGDHNVNSMWHVTATPGTTPQTWQINYLGSGGAVPFVALAGIPGESSSNADAILQWLIGPVGGPVGTLPTGNLGWLNNYFFAVPADAPWIRRVIVPAAVATQLGGVDAGFLAGNVHPQANTPFSVQDQTLQNVPVNTQFMAENNDIGPAGATRLPGPISAGEVTGGTPNLNLLHNDTRNLVVGSVLQIEFPVTLRNYLYNFHYAGGPQLTPTGDRPANLTPLSQWNERYWVVEVQVTGGTFNWGSAHVAFPADLPNRNVQNPPTNNRLDMIQPHTPGGMVRGQDFAGTLHQNPAQGNRAHIYIPVSMIVEGHAGLSVAGDIWTFSPGPGITFGDRGVAGLNPTVDFNVTADNPHGTRLVGAIVDPVSIRVPMPIRTTTGEGNVTVGIIPGSQAFLGEVNRNNGDFTPLTRPAIPAGNPFFTGVPGRHQTFTTPTGTVNLAVAAEVGRTVTTITGTGVDRNTLRFNVLVAEQTAGGLPSGVPFPFDAGHGGQLMPHLLTGAFELVAPAGFRWPEHLATAAGGIQLQGQFNFQGIFQPNGGTHTIGPATPVGTWVLTNPGLGAQGGLTQVPLTAPIPPGMGQQRFELIDTTLVGGGLGIGADQGWYTIGNTTTWGAAGGVNNSLEMLPHPALGITHYRATVSQDGTVLRVEYRTSGVREPGVGNIFLRDVILQAVNLINPPEQAVYISIRNVGQASPVPNNFPTTPGNPGDTTTVTPQQNLYVGTTSDWAINMTVSGDVPELISGRLISPNIQNPNPVHHRAARVRVQENIVDSWWTERVTTFTVTEGVRIREVVFSGVDNIQNADISVLEDQRHFNLNRADSQNVRINHNVLQVHNLRRQPNQRTAHGGGTIGFYVDIYLNIPANFEGPINLYLGEQVAGPNDPDTRSVTIAHATPPITVTTELTSIRVGYQFMPVGNFTITENMAGALLLNEPVFISITDGLFSELQIAPSFDVAVTAGNLEISTPGVALGGNIWAAGIEPNIEFTIDGASTVPSTIHFSNVTARLAAVAPASTMGYDLVVWGPAVAQNVDHPRVTIPVAPGVGGWSQEGTAFHNIIGADAIQGTAGAIREANQINPRDLFNTLYAGIATPYLFLDEHFIGHPIVSSPVTFQEDGVVIVGGVAQNFDPAVWGAFEVNNSGVGVLPARLAFAVLFEGADPYDVDLFQWEAPASRFVIDSTGHNIWFQTGNTTMGVRGGTHTIMSGTGAAAFPYAAYVNPVTERMMLPIRAFADALGLDVQFIEGVGGGPASIVLTP